MNLKNLLKPKKIAIVGASEKTGFGGDTVRNAKKYMDEKDFFLVNPNRDMVQGIKTYPSLSAIEEKIDLVVICTPQSTVEGLLEEAASKKIKAAVVFASGYGETGTEEGKQAEASLKKKCEELDIALMGPNCAGFINYIDNVHSFAFLSNDRDRRGSVGVVSQSGQLILSMMDSPMTSFSYVISAGNATVAQIEDYLNFLVDDEDTKVVAAYIEGTKHSEKLIKILEKAAKRKKPVVVLKTGRSQKGQALAASHTGSLSGSDQAYDALFDKYGVIRVDDLEELISTARALACLKQLPKGKNLGLVSLSGGETGICADLGELSKVHYPDFSKETLAKLNDMLPDYATPNNPLDSTATLSYDSDLFAKVLEIMMKDSAIDLVAVGYSLLQEISDPAIHYIAEAMEKVTDKAWVKPMVMIPFIENTRNPEYAKKLEEIGVPVLPTTTYAFKILSSIFEFSTYNAKDHAFISEAEKKVSTVEINGSGAMTEAESKKILRDYAVPVGRYAIVNSADEAVESFRKMKVDKVVAKIDSPDILHKSDAGCVILSLSKEEEVREAYQKILDNAKSYDPEAKIRGVQIGEMLPKGLELIVGVNQSEFGPMIVCGLGGIFVEIFKDVSINLAPLSHEEAKNMLTSLQGYRLIEGYRGSSGVDLTSLIDILEKVSHLALDHQEMMQELDINPVMAYEDRAVAVDALYIRKNQV